MRLLEALRAEGQLEADQLAERVGLHLNTVRAHLDVLRDAGLVSARPQPSGGPGRPRLAFAATERVPSEGDPASHRLLAQVLTAALQEQSDGPEQAVHAGRVVGQGLALGAGPGRADPKDRRGAVLGLLERLGFAPQAASDAASGGGELIIELHRCPFSDLASTNSAIVCSVHRGLLEGACEQLGGRRESLQLIPFVAPGLCEVHLSRS